MPAGSFHIQQVIVAGLQLLNVRLKRSLYSETYSIANGDMMKISDGSSTVQHNTRHLNAAYNDSASINSYNKVQDSGYVEATSGEILWHSWYIQHLEARCIG